jgi:tRNA modification GTPase
VGSFAKQKSHHLDVPDGGIFAPQRTHPTLEFIVSHQDTITAIATPPGKGGVGVIRISGPLTKSISESILHQIPEPRKALFTPFYCENNEILDEGIALFFKGPNSFTGEDVLELQGHGGPVILDRIIKTLLNIGARLARPGEFSERAFTNDKMDLAQAEAVADLIDASSEQAAQSAMRSLQGEFSNKINELVESLIALRIYVEAAIDFPEEEIDFLSDGKVLNQLNEIIENLTKVKISAKQGAILRDGMTVVIAGKPNAGKSSLLNALSGKLSAIVTEIEGTTRDILKEYINIDGMPLHIIDTAGLRESNDVIEQEGIKRALKAIENADEVLLMVDASKEKPINKALIESLLPKDCLSKPITIIKNKIDLINEKERIVNEDNHEVIYLSAKNNQGIDLLKNHMKEKMGYNADNEGVFIARRRHLDAINRAEKSLDQGYNQLTKNKAGELLAEELKQAQNALSEITGEFTSDDLLGKIFSSFCIGK